MSIVGMLLFCSVLYCWNSVFSRDGMEESKLARARFSSMDSNLSNLIFKTSRRHTLAWAVGQKSSIDRGEKKFQPKKFRSSYMEIPDSI